MCFPFTRSYEFPSYQVQALNRIINARYSTRVKDLEYQRVDTGKRVTNLEVVTDKVLKKQYNLHSKVGDQDAKCEASS